MKNTYTVTNEFKQATLKDYYIVYADGVDLWYVMIPVNNEGGNTGGTGLSLKMFKTPQE